MKKWARIILLIVSMVLIIAAVFYYLVRGFNLDYYNILVTAMVPILSYVIDMYYSYQTDKKEREEAKAFYENIRGSVILRASAPQNLQDIKSSTQEQKRELKQEATTDILELMLANMMEIKDYYVLSKTQARNSFGLAVIMCILGFVLMGISVAAAFLNSTNLISTIVPAIGAAIVELIAGTSLIVYKKSLDQLNRYYNSLHSNERFLSIVNIVSKVSSSKQDDVYIEIIKSQIGLISTEEP